MVNNLVRNLNFSKLMPYLLCKVSVHSALFNVLKKFLSGSGIINTQLITMNRAEAISPVVIEFSTTI